MIDLEKQRKPSEEEIQEWVDKVYEHAVDLYSNKQMSWGEIEQELINQGLDAGNAATVVSNLKEQEHEAKKKTQIKNWVWRLMGFRRYCIDCSHRWNIYFLRSCLVGRLAYIKRNIA